jgi:hypothetical protein
MKFTRVVFAVAGLFGCAALVPLYRADGNPMYYGLLGAVAAWQVLFLTIAWQPVKLRLAIIPAVLEKLLWVLTFAVLYGQGQITATDLLTATSVHGLLGVLFAIAYFRTPRSAWCG